MKLRDLRHLDKDDLLRALGLEERRSGGETLLSGLGWFAAGALIGATAALLIAPRPGSQLRHDLRERLRKDGARGVSALSEEVRQTSGV